MIKLSSYDTTVRDLQKFRNDILDQLGESIYSITDLKTFLYKTLLQIDQTCNWIENTSESIEAGAKIVHKHFMTKKARIVKLGDPDIDVTVEKSHTEYYSQFILSISKAPGEMYEYLESNVRDHLIELNALITRYEEEPAIRRIVNANQIPRDHEERVVWDFYKRCLNTQKVILDYFLNGLKKRALSKATYNPLGLSWAFGEDFRDFPYNFGRLFYEEYYDYKKISGVSHRISEFGISEGPYLEKLYSNDKEEFYKLLFAKNPPLSIFQHLQFYLNLIPLKNERKPFFDELEKLFFEERWMAFYALALPQIEGLFTEMCNVAFTKKPPGALSDKVNIIRPLHFLSDSYFDYFQYLIPRLRNKFMHIGYDVDFKLKAYDLLTDLECIVKIYSELDNPLIKIHRIHKQRKVDDFISYKEFASYFILIEAIDKKQALEIKSDLELFEKDFLQDNGSIDYILSQTITTLPKLVNEFTVKIEQLLGDATLAYNFSILKWNKLQPIVDKQVKVKDLRNDLSFYLYDSEELIYRYLFLKGFRKHLPSSPTHLHFLANKSFKENGLFCENIIALKKANED